MRYAWFGTKWKNIPVCKSMNDNIWGILSMLSTERTTFTAAGEF